MRTWIGERFGNLVVVDLAKGTDRFHPAATVKCDCGRTKVVSRGHLSAGRTKSCGCKEGNKVHGHTKFMGLKSPTYISWGGMKGRCLNPKNCAFRWYGGRGISICSRWLNSFENFLEDMGERPRGMTLDRINSDGNYEPENCRWATKKQQVSTQRKPWILFPRQSV